MKGCVCPLSVFIVALIAFGSCSGISPVRISENSRQYVENAFIEDAVDSIHIYTGLRETLGSIFSQGIRADSQDVDAPRRVLEGQNENESVGGSKRKRISGAMAKPYLDDWVVHLRGGSQLAKRLAHDLGYYCAGEIQGLEDYYRMVRRQGRLDKRDMPEFPETVSSDAEILWAEQQYAKTRMKRDDPKSIYNEESLSILRELFSDDELNNAESQKPLKRVKRFRPGSNLYKWRHMYNDELWDKQWYMYDTRTRNDLPQLDLGILKVFQAGITGKGVKVTVLDDGLEWKHDEIIDNYDHNLSYDMNDDDFDPTPQYDGKNSHGTKCAGEIAMKPNNKKCGVGVAYGAEIGGIRMLDGIITDYLEASSLAYSITKKGDVVSCSWGPADTGDSLEAPGPLTRVTFQKGVTEGRGGKGLIYVWASGNGGLYGDNCNCDGYTSSIYTISIGSASESGSFPWYGEACSSTLGVTLSSGAYADQEIPTADLNNTCTIHFTGTSASAPLAAGAVALALEANAELTWRDVQHLIVWTSQAGPLNNDDKWTKNGIELLINPRFGFGLLNAEEMVGAAKKWETVPQKVQCLVPVDQKLPMKIIAGKKLKLKFSANSCSVGKNEIVSLEHVEVITSLDYTRRGDLAIDLLSPNGTSSALLTSRPRDKSNNGFDDWRFMSVHTWGEDPRGIWEVTINDENSLDNTGSLTRLDLLLHGTTVVPKHMQKKKKYITNYQRVNKRAAPDDNLMLTAEKLKHLSIEELENLLVEKGLKK